MNISEQFKTIIKYFGPTSQVTALGIFYGIPWDKRFWGWFV